MIVSLMMGIVLLSLYWTFAVPLYVPASPVWAAVALVLGLVFLGRAAAKSPSEPTPPAVGTAALIVAALVVASLGLPLPYRTGPLLALAGVLGWLAFSRTGGQPVPSAGAVAAAAGGTAAGRQPVLRVWYALALGGFILVAQSLVPPLYPRIVSAGHDRPLLRWALSALLTLFGYDTAVGQSNVFIEIMRELQGFPVTTERLALFTFSLIFVGFLIAVAASPLLRRSAVRLLVLGSVVTVLYALVRYALLVVIYLYLVHRMGYEDATSYVNVFWSPWWTAFTVWPLGWCLAGLAPKDGWLERLDWLENLAGPSSDDARFGRRTWVLAVLAAVAFIAYFALPEPAGRKKGRVLVDEFHSNWEKTTRPFDTTWYGQEAGYNYAAVYEYLSRFYEMGRLEEPITPAALKDCDVLIVKIPTRKYDRTETATLEQFVRRGGGLFLIGEHTNVFGSGEYINALARMFGFEYRYDCLFDTSRKFEEVWRPPPLLPHPVVQDLSLFFFQVSCSIRPLAFWGEPVMIGACLKALPVDYHAPNFYPQVIDRSDMDFGPFVQTWGVNHARGRVLGFTDSTSFSNFCAFEPGKPEFLLAAIEWLNHRNYWGWWKVMWFALGCAALAASLSFLVLSRDALRVASLAILVVAGAVPLLAFGARQINRRFCGAPTPERPLQRVYFERAHCDYDLPIEGFTPRPDRSFDVFYQWVLRLGVFPFVGETVDECARKAQAIVLPRPNREFSEPEIEKLKSFVEKGGGLLVLDDPGQPAPVVEPLLRAFQLGLSREGPPYQGVVTTPEGTTFTVEGAWPVVGGTPLAWGAGGEILAAASKRGEGHVVVASFANRFCDQSMGGGWGAKPDADLLAVYQLEYTLLRTALAAVPTTGTTLRLPARPIELATTSTQAATRPTTATQSRDLPTSR